MDEQKPIPEYVPERRNCPACNMPGIGNYCMHCGEKMEHEIITLPYLIKHIPDLLDVEHGLFYTMTTLVKRPGRELRSYFMGNRSRHYKPLKYVLFLGTIAGVINIMVADFDPVVPDLDPESDYAKMINLGQEWLGLILMCIFPVMALVTWRLFRARPYTYGEHLVAQAFLMGQWAVLNLLVTPFRALENNSIYQVVGAIGGWGFFIYVVFFYYDWLYGRRTFSGVMRCLGLAFLMYITALITLFISVIVIYYIREAIISMF